MKNSIFFVLVGILLSSCAKSIIIEREPNVVFSNYKTYNWNVLEESTRNPYYNNEKMTQSLVKAIEHSLSKKGLVKLEGNSDILLDFHVYVKENSFEKTYCPAGFYRAGRYLPEIPNWPQCDVPLQTQSFDDGTLIIDIVDNKTSQLIWRGSASEAIDDPKYASDILSRKVHRILNRLTF